MPVAIKAVKFHYQPTEAVSELLETFRKMVNHAIWVGLEEKPRTRFQLIKLVYQDLKAYGLHTHYILSACEVGFSILRNHRRRRRTPYARRLFLKLDNQSYWLNYMMLRIPVKPRQFLLIPLKGGEYQLSFLRDATLKRGSITITATGTVVVAFSKEAAVLEPLSKVAYDVNEKNVTSSRGERYDTTGVANVKHQYSRIRASIAGKTHRDRRTKEKLLSKYGKNERSRAVQALHRISKKIVREAKAHRRAIVLENLRKILFSHRRGNGEGRKMRGRLHRWSFRELQRQIEYKGRWEGIVVEYVRAANTSKHCSSCGCINQALRYAREWTCPHCGTTLDRDLNAARNILARSRVKEAAAVRPSDEGLAEEGMVQLATVTRS